MDYRANVFQVPNTLCTKYIVYQSIKCTQLSQNDKLLTISNKILCKIAATLATTDIFLIKNVTRMLQQEGILSALKQQQNLLKMSWNFFDVMLLLLKTDEACYINK